MAILVTVVLPAEYGIDQTRIGSFLGLTGMVEIKAQLAEEAEADWQMDTAADDQSSLLGEFLRLFVGAAHGQEGPGGTRLASRWLRAGLLNGSW